MSNPMECAGCGKPLVFDYIGERHAGCSITTDVSPVKPYPHKIYTERKGKMSKHRRNILNLLEYILEVDDTIDSVYNAFCLHVSQVDEDMTWINDEEWAQWFEEYAEKLNKKVREANRVDGT